MDIQLDKLFKSMEKGYARSERLLWKRLQARRLAGLKFERRRLIGSYLVEFVCFEKKLVIVINDEKPEGEREKEPDKIAWLASQGFSILQFADRELSLGVEGALAMIRSHCGIPDHAPLPLRAG